MKNPRWRRALGIAGAALLLAACGGGDGDEDVASPEGAPAEDASSTSPQSQDDGSDVDPDGVVRLARDLVGQAQGGFTWDPAAALTQAEGGLLHYVYGSFLRPTSDGELVPDLAERTSVVDESTIEIVLRPDLTFADGTPLDAAAAKAGLERNLAATGSTAFGADFFNLESIEVTAPETLVLTIANGTAASWHDTFLASIETMIVPPDADFTRPSGAGPLQVVEYTPEQRVLLEKNTAYWDADSILIGGVELVHAPDPQSGATALGADQVDIAIVETSLIPALPAGTEVLAEVDPNRLMSMQLCKREGPLAEPQVRKAINKAIDREVINDVLFAGAFEPALGLWPEGHRFHDPDVEDAVAYDPEAARELLAEAGYADGFQFDIFMLEGGGVPEAMEIVQQQLAEIGVTAGLVRSPNYVTDFLQAQKPGAGAVPTMAPNRGKLRQWAGDALGNTCGYDDPELESLAAELASVSDTSDEAVELWHRIEQKVVADDTLSVFLLFGADPMAYDPERLGGVAAMPYIVPVPDLRETYVRGG